MSARSASRKYAMATLTLLFCAICLGVAWALSAAIFMLLLGVGLATTLLMGAVDLITRRNY